MITTRASLFGYVSGAFSLFMCGALVFANEPEKATSDFVVKEVRIDLNQLKKAIASSPDREVDAIESSPDREAEAVGSSIKMMQAESADSEVSRLIKENTKLRQERDALKKQNSGLAVRNEISKALATVKLKRNENVAGPKELCLAANDKLETLDVRLFNAEGVLLPSFFFQWRVISEENENMKDHEIGNSPTEQNKKETAAASSTVGPAEVSDRSATTDNKNDIAGALSQIKNASNKLSLGFGGETEIQVTLKSDSSASRSPVPVNSSGDSSGIKKCLNVVCTKDVSEAVYQQAIKPWEVFYGISEGDDKSFLRQWVEIANFTAYPWNNHVKITLSNLGESHVIESKSFSLGHFLEPDHAAVKIIEHMEILKHEYKIDLDAVYKREEQAKSISQEFVFLRERPAFLPEGNYREDFRFEAYSRQVGRVAGNDTLIRLGDEPKTYAVFNNEAIALPPEPVSIFAGVVQLQEFQRFNIDLYHGDVHRSSLGRVSLLKRVSQGWNLVGSDWSKIKTREGDDAYTRSIEGPSPVQSVELTESKLSSGDFKDNPEYLKKIKKAADALPDSGLTGVGLAIKTLVHAQRQIDNNVKLLSGIKTQVNELTNKYESIKLGTDIDANASRRAQLRAIWEARQELLRTKAQLEVENARLEGVIDEILFPSVSIP